MEHLEIAKYLNQVNASLYEKLGDSRGKQTKPLWDAIDFIRELRSELDDVWVRENRDLPHTRSPYYRAV